MKLTIKPRQIFFILTGLFAIAVSVYAAVPQKINFQGRLTDAGGNPITGSQSITFSIWDAASGGTQLWTEAQPVDVSTGIYSVALGKVTPLSSNVFSVADRWLEIKVGTDDAMVPRLKMQAVAYAFVAERADTAAGLDAPSGFGVSITTNLVVGVGAGKSTFTASGNLNVPSMITAGEFVGDGSGLTNLQSVSPSLRFPDGFSGLIPVVERISSISPYIVPDQMNLYITRILDSSLARWYAQLTADGGTNIDHWSHTNPRIVGPGSVVASTASTITFDIAGFIVPATVSAIVKDLPPFGSYTVPSGQNFYFFGFQGTPNDLEWFDFDYPIIDGGIPVNIVQSASPLVLGAGRTITNPSESITWTINGYLKPQ